MRRYPPIPPIGDCTELRQWYRAGRDGTVWSRRKRGVPTPTIGKWRQLRTSVPKNLGRVSPTVRLAGDGNKPRGKLFRLDVCVCSAFNPTQPGAGRPAAWAGLAGGCGYGGKPGTWNP